jgi:uncharacterized membrane protein
VNEKRSTIYHIAFVGVMAALVFVSNYISIPVASSRLHVANAVCLLAGMLFGGVKGGLAAAIGSALFDLTFPAYVAEAWITFINKGAMALVAGLIVRSVPEPSRLRLILGGAAGAALYIALYLLKSYFQIRYVTPVPVETIGPLLLEKLAASSVNGIFAVIVAPLLYTVLAPGIKHLQKS